MTELAFHLERTALIRARRSTVFRYLTDSERFAAWFGKGSRIDPRPTGEVFIQFPGNVTVSGTVKDVVEGERIAFSYGYDDPKKPIRPGASLVSVVLRDVPAGTELRLRHDVANESVRDEHDPGWRFQLSLLANAVTAEEHAGVSQRVADWFRAFAEPELEARLRSLELATTEDVSFRDRWACITGRRELAAHVQALHVHQKGIVWVREGDVRACQGTALVDWSMQDRDGKVVGRGTNVMDLTVDGRIHAVTALLRA